MGISDLTEHAVRAAMAEHDELGVEAFCGRYGFEEGSDDIVVAGDKRYGSQALVAAAHGFLPDGTPLTPADVVDTAAVKDKLLSLGFVVRRVRLPDWTRDELVLACALLFENGRKALKAGDPRVQELSRLLRTRVSGSAGQYGDKFRSVNSVQRKLYDLQTRLPEYTKIPTKGGQLDLRVLEEFQQDEVAMMVEAAEIRSRTDAAVRSSRSNAEQAWALFCAEGERKYGGNGGYPDVLGEQYVYDNQVANSRRLAVGDLIVIRDGDRVHGVSRVEKIDTQSGVLKRQRVCPECAGSQFDERRRQVPKYRCRRTNCNHEFDQPRDTTVEVTQFVAVYGAGYRALDGAIPLDELRTRMLDRAPQNAIRPLDHDGLLALLKGLAVPTPAMPGPRRRTVPAGGHREGRGKVRVGQDKFRENLLADYGLRCAITGPCPAEALEAAHLRKFAEHESHDDGLLMRADVHKLFDRGLLAIHPETWTVVIAPTLADYDDYAKLDGLPVVKGPDPAAIRDHYLTVTAAWGVA
ncbi:HNH endonuclease [Amycolatopsis keratiniphila]|uniref:Uncharacterized protein n=1 Tax=Amycolatopsis keratiniphila TaxID=129921 RepID=R4T5M8_9PSEU|nr:HNH endonuclease signature motif containing protein [Amycolatopsis keratiniphila]AGM05933.1 hypothetical protein AORI_3348 [Amycolatopsis keratiniphila]